MSDSDNIYAPRNNTAARSGIQRIPFTTASAQTTLSAELQKTGWVRCKAVGADVDFTIDSTGGTLVKDASGSGTTVGYTLAAGQTEDFWIAGASVVTTIGSASGNLIVSRAGKDRVQLASG